MINEQLTIVMPFLKEGMETVNTVQSILDTADPRKVRIIAIDDASDSCNEQLRKFQTVTVIRNVERLGCPASSDVGVRKACTDFVLLIDGHMRFRNDGWFEAIIDALRREPKTIFCTSCGGLNSMNRDPYSPNGLYYLNYALRGAPEEG